ncbi:hypothetical protein AYJ54_07950 [Bradyrhizobium centrolobii]|uniref:HTH merR-type domain-containing protein n=1 Tax=Bradyrhizobium centrolobii TaxID=1505087 RepID=A0A176YVV7_9BRAD|nr:hypothetical protein [Bradyrhizobium centrolobii]OAF11849.1 hypothetical protein AYJ54_07950 [Bradyrhizobium centrolobii]
MTDLLKDYAPRPQLAEQLGVSEKTLIRWELDGRGPPVTRVGRTPLYYIPSAMQWLRAQERAPDKAA